jgi:hypothetical protein
MGFSTKRGLVNAVTVRIWFPNKAQASTLDTALTGVGLGHAGLTVKLDGVRHYITWQVGDGTPVPFKEHQALNYMTRDAYVPEGQMCKAKDETWMSGMRWGQMNGDSGRGRYDGYKRSQCDWKMRIKTRQPNENGAGLDAGAIIAWWDHRVKNENVYKLISTNQNCTGCVAEALKAGGLGGSPSGYWLVSAADLQTWILDRVNKQNLQAEAGYE